MYGLSCGIGIIGPNDIIEFVLKCKHTHTHTFHEAIAEIFF
jgi:hypothetical protein